MNLLFSLTPEEMMEPQRLIGRARKFVAASLSMLPPSYFFHNLDHTKAVAKAAKKIGVACHLPAEQVNTAVLAALFHDVGYSDGANCHEERSAAIASKQLCEWGASNALIQRVTGAIMATKLPQQPRCMIDMVLCDADLAHLASAQYEAHAERLKLELKATQGVTFDNEETWRESNIRFMKAHCYFTEYGKTILERRKKVNLKRLMQSMQL